MSWWQGLGISIATSAHLIPERAGMSPEEVGARVQAFAICIEMFFAGVSHHFIFSYRDWYSADPEERTPRLAILEAMAEFDEAHPGWDSSKTLGGGAIGEAMLSSAAVKATLSALKSASKGATAGGDAGGGRAALRVPLWWSPWATAWGWWG